MTHFLLPTSDPISALPTTDIVTVDISDFILDGDYLSASCPEFPASKLDLAKSYLEFTSNEFGDFSEGPTDSLAFTNSDPVPAEGDAELRWPISDLTTIDKAAITGVRFRVYAKSECNFRCLSIRAIGESWKYAPVDIDTLWHRTERPPTTNGAVSQAFEFPNTEEEGWPKEWPILFRSDNSSGAKDPRPINMSVSASFRTGSLAKATGESDATSNHIALYFRDVPEDDQIQLELNGKTPTAEEETAGTEEEVEEQLGYNQAQLNGLGRQPDFGEAAYVTRKQSELDIHDQADLDEDSQFVLERLPDFSSHAWIEVKLKWGFTEANNELIVHNADGEGYEFKEIKLEKTNEEELDKGQYVMIVDLVDNSIRVQIFHTDQVGTIEQDRRVFDSGEIIDDTIIKRRRGRFGWWTQLLDGDSYLTNIRTRGVTHGELISKEFQSITPVKGVSLFAGSTSDSQLVTDYFATNEKSTLTFDPSASTGGKAIKIVTTPLESLQGVMTNDFVIDDPKNIRISLDLKFPSTEVSGSGLIAFLLGKYDSIIPIRLSPYVTGTWSHVKAYIADDVIFETGQYRLVLVQSMPIVATTWWIENLFIKTSTVKWSARSYASDPWNLAGDRWQPVDFTLNSLNGGVVFKEPGNGLQIRAQALRQDAEIHEYKAIPQYATLGRMVWDDEAPSPGEAPVGLEILTSKEGLEVTFTGVALDNDGSIVAYYWSFGDDTYDSGKAVTHTYDREGSYVVTLTVKDNFGNATSTQAGVSVS
jgi:hypothetical protein